MRTNDSLQNAEPGRTRLNPPPTRKTRRIAAAILAGALLAVAIWRVSHPAVTHPDTHLSGFSSGSTPANEDYDNLFRYFVQGFETHKSKAGGLAFFSGLPSTNGARSDALEGFSRSAPLWAAWVNSGRENTVRLQSGVTVDLTDEFRRGLLAGTNPSSADYWGTIADHDQRIVEAADIALSLWLLKARVWPALSSAQKTQVAAWLQQAASHLPYDNNWRLFPAFVSLVLDNLGVATDRRNADTNYQRFKQFYRGDGWFSDGLSGEGKAARFDYYNAWEMHYRLYWIERVAPDFDTPFIQRARREFLHSYKYLIGPQGFPVMGRSVCYRMAAVAPLIFGQQTDPAEIAPAEARRGLDATWSYFIQRGALEEGNVTQGYCAADPRILDNYSGPASCLWALRSLVVAFAQPPASNFWIVAPGKLPVEIASYSVSVPATQWTITGDLPTSTIQIHKPGRDPHSAPPLESYGLLRQAAGALFRRPFRPKNEAAKYDAGVYDSAHPFCGCFPVSPWVTQ